MQKLTWIAWLLWEVMAGVVGSARPGVGTTDEIQIALANCQGKPCASILPDAAAWKQVSHRLAAVCHQSLLITRASDLADELLRIRRLAGTYSHRGGSRDFQKTARIIEDALDSSLSKFGPIFFFKTVIPFVACLALYVPQMFPYGLPVLQHDGIRHLRLTKLQVAGLVAGGFWGSVPVGPPPGAHNLLLNRFDFSGGFLVSTTKVTSLMAYFCSISRIYLHGADGSDRHSHDAWEALHHRLIIQRAWSVYTPDAKLPKDETKQEALSATNAGTPQWLWRDSLLSSNEEYIDFILRIAPPDTKFHATWFNAESPLLPVRFIHDSTIEDADGALQADFANKYIGGGVLGRGSVQEEIRFTVFPELLASLILVPRMGDEEAVVVIGAERFANYSGYGLSFRFESAVIHEAAGLPFGCHGGRHGSAPLDSWRRRDVQLVAFDALNFIGRHQEVQYLPGNVIREAVKALAACQGDPLENLKTSKRPFATGNWGSGVFMGDLQLKAILQWLASSFAGREIHYYSFGDRRANSFPAVAAALRQRFGTVGNLYRHLMQVLERRRAAIRRNSGRLPDLFSQVLK